MSKQHYLAAIARFCNMDKGASEEEITQCIRKLGGIDIEITEQDVILWAPDIKKRVRLWLLPEMSFDEIASSLSWGFDLIQNYREWHTVFSMEEGEVQYRLRGDRTVEVLYPSCTNLSEDKLVPLIRERINDRLAFFKVSDRLYDMFKSSETESTIIFPISEEKHNQKENV